MAQKSYETKIVSHPSEMPSGKGIVTHVADGVMKAWDPRSRTEYIHDPHEVIRMEADKKQAPSQASRPLYNEPTYHPVGMKPAGAPDTKVSSGRASIYPGGNNSFATVPSEQPKTRAERAEKQKPPQIVDVSHAKPIHSGANDESLHLPRFHLSDRPSMVPTLVKNNQTPLKPIDILRIQQREEKTRQAESGMVLATQSTLYGAHQIANRRTTIIGGFLDLARSALETLKANRGEVVSMIRGGGLGREHRTRSVSQMTHGKPGRVVESHSRDNVRPGTRLRTDSNIPLDLHIGSESSSASFAMGGEHGSAHAENANGFASAQAFGDGGIAFASGVSFGEVSLSVGTQDSFDLDT